MLPEVTVGLPVSGESLSSFELAIRSIFMQSVPDWELILILDGADETLTEAAYAIDDSRVRVLRHSTRKGLAHGLNSIAQEAKGRFIVRMDADDVMRPHRIEQAQSFLRHNPNKCVIGSTAIVIDEQDQVRGMYVEPQLPVEPVQLLNSNALTHPTVVMRREWALGNPYNTSLVRSQDKGLWLSSFRDLQRFAKMEEPTLFYRIDSRLSAKKQALSSTYDRRLIRRDGKKVANSRAVATYVARSYVKQAIFAGAVAAGVGQKLYSRKFTSISPTVRSLLEAELHDIRRQEVPGWH